MKLKALLTPLAKSLTTTSRCKICFKEINWGSIWFFTHKEVSVCDECFKKMGIIDEETKIDGINALILYEYNEYIREILYKFKGCDDYELKDVFFERRRNYLKIKYHGYVIVHAPSVVEDDKRRGYNHVEAMCSSLKLPVLNIIHKKVNFKQSDLSKIEREKVLEKLYIDDVDLSNKKILLVDDVTTSRSTIKAMISLVKTKNPKKISILIMAKHKELIKN